MVAASTRGLTAADLSTAVLLSETGFLSTAVLSSTDLSTAHRALTCSLSCFVGSLLLSELLLGLLVAMADHTVEKAVGSTHWVLVAFFLGVVDFFVDVMMGILIGGRSIIIEVS